MNLFVNHVHLTPAMCYRALPLNPDSSRDRCTRVSIPWAPESSYVVPAPAKDGQPNSAETRQDFVQTWSALDIMESEEHDFKIKT